MPPIELGPIDSYSGMTVRREFKDTDQKPFLEGAIFVPATSMRVIVYPRASKTEIENHEYPQSLMLGKDSHEEAVMTVKDNSLAIDAIKTILRDGQPLDVGQQILTGRNRTLAHGARVLE